jgi:putative ABC transport system permease protein
MRGLLLKLLRRRKLQRDLEAELAFHEQLSAEHNNPVRLGNRTLIEEQSRDLWRFNFIENLWRDVSYGVRSLRRSPTLVFSAILSLGLGIGVNLAIFSLAVEFLLSDPSVTDPASLALVRIAGNSHSGKNVVDRVQLSGVFADVAGVREEAYINWNDGTQTRRLYALVSTKNWFTALGVPIAHGRGFVPNDTDEVVVLTHHFWRRHFAADPFVVGRTMILDGKVYTIVGILPATHRTVIGFGLLPDVYVPPFSDTNLRIYARLKPEMPIAQAAAGLRTLTANLDTQETPGPQNRFNSQVVPIAGLGRFFSEGPELKTLGLFFVMLLTVVGLVLLIASINVAGLLLARASARRREIAIRQSLGAGRLRILQQMLVESLLLCVVGTAAGLGLAKALAIVIARVEIPVPLPIHIDIQPDWRVALYAVMLTLFATVASGLAPALQSLGASILPDLHLHGKLRLRRTMVVGQIAVSTVILAAGFLFLRNLFQSTAIDPGFNLRDTAWAQAYLSPARYAERGQRDVFLQRAMESLRALPGIDAVAASRGIPFRYQARMGSQLTFAESGEQVRITFLWNAVTPEYFDAMGIPILKGKPIEQTGEGGPRPVVVNQVFVERYMSARSAVGTVFLWGSDGKTPYQIVAVASSTKNMTLGEDAAAQLYEISRDRILASTQPIQFVLKSKIPPASQLETIRQALRQVDPDAGTEVDTLYSSISFAFFPSQVGAALMGSVGTLGLLLSAVGLYGTMIYSVSRRTHEIGIRMAVGATRLDISSMVVFESAKLIALGSMIGIVISAFVTKPLAAFLVPGIKPADPHTFLLVLVVLSLTGLIASWGPARRASTVDPMFCLRHE